MLGIKVAFDAEDEWTGIKVASDVGVGGSGGGISTPEDLRLWFHFPFYREYWMNRIRDPPPFSLPLR